MRGIVRVLDRLEEYLCAVILLVMVLLGFANVVVRYLTSFSLAFSEELLVNLFVWLSLLGTAIGVKRHAHLGVTVLTDRLPPSWQRGVLVLTTLAGIALFAVVIRQGWDLTVLQRRWGSRTYSTDLPMWWFSAGIPVAGVLIVMRFVQTVWRQARGGAEQATPEPTVVDGAAKEGARGGI